MNITAMSSIILKNSMPIWLHLQLICDPNMYLWMISKFYDGVGFSVSPLFMEPATHTVLFQSHSLTNDRENYVLTETSSPSSPAQSNKLRKKFDTKCWPHHPHEDDPGREAMESNVANESAQGWHGSVQALDCYCFMCVCVYVYVCMGVHTHMEVKAQL